jgi:hypothetical protein
MPIPAYNHEKSDRTVAESRGNTVRARLRKAISEGYIVISVDAWGTLLAQLTCMLENLGCLGAGVKQLEQVIALFLPGGYRYSLGCNKVECRRDDFWVKS